jgi:hypothetical protein
MFINCPQLWIDRHQPKTLADLAVHPKKIEEIKFWFEQQINNRNGTKVKLPTSHCKRLINISKGVFTLAILSAKTHSAVTVTVVVLATLGLCHLR